MTILFAFCLKTAEKKGPGGGGGGGGMMGMPMMPPPAARRAGPAGGAPPMGGGAPPRPGPPQAAPPMAMPGMGARGPPMGGAAPPRPGPPSAGPPQMPMPSAGPPGGQRKSVGGTMPAMSPQDKQQMMQDHGAPPMRGPAAPPMGRPPAPPGGGSRGPQVQALYAYKGERPADLSFAKGDTFTLIKEDPSGWWEGEHNGKRGSFPGNYVKKVEGGAAPAPAAPAPVPQTQKAATLNPRANPGLQQQLQASRGPAAAPPPVQRAPSGPRARALYDFTGQQPGDLTFRAEDIITLNKQDGNWWTGTVNGRTGVFPSK